MSKADSTAKLTTIFAMPPEGGVEVPMICPCCEAALGVRGVYDGSEKESHLDLPVVHAYIMCRSCAFSASVRIGEDRISITWGGGGER